MNQSANAVGQSIGSASGTSQQQWRALIIIAIIALVIFLIILLSFFLPRPAATVKLTPLSQPLSGSLTVSVPAHQIVSTQQDAQTKVSTGQPVPGISASGVLTFENFTLSWVTIPAGTSVTSDTGEEVVTDKAVNIPPDPVTPGVASITAHAAGIGSSGNIQVMSINKACCFKGIFVFNKSAFSGGIDSQITPTVQQSDIDGIAKPLEASLTRKALSTIQAHLASDEHLLSPTLQCSSKIASTSKVGESATTLTVNVSLTCSESAYSLETVPRSAENWLKHQATLQLDPHFLLVSAIETTIKQTTARGNTGVDVLVSMKGTWEYQFTAADKLHMIQSIARKTRSEATSWLKQQAGVAAVSISITGPIFNRGKNDTLPDDFGTITLHT